MLPQGKISTAKVELSGGEVEIHSLTMGQSIIAGKLEGTPRVIACISFATGTDKRDVEEWLETAPAGDATKLLNAITDVSGLSAEAQFQERP
jgi:hypothetical protein